MQAKEKPKSESWHQIRLATWLDSQGFIWTHVPLGGQRGKIAGAKLKREGAKAGFPDVAIFSGRKGAKLNCPGIVLELKREHGGKLSKAQKKWIEDLGRLGWVTIVAHGSDEAISSIDQCIATFSDQGLQS